ncbi:hypothetical protein Nepgr_011952 [Nepenthes gracilis]|uniref:Uncharacterized protein n=1 Tax=Nepenthes gracilis TaxID=150966 RepID=A0AAD3XMT9_NEPGR|nr:hypothetical protein Nepgr_011952 [Nepenthes gracilis]
MKPTGKGRKAHTKLAQRGQKDRKSGTGINGCPKKGGHGGKFTWSGDKFCGSGDGYLRSGIGFPAESVDAKDPNFEDHEEIETAFA